MPTAQQSFLPDANNFRTVARALTVVENDLPGAAELLQNLDLSKQVPVIGITGPPGAGKSTLVNALITELCTDGKKVAVLAIDPTSPFNYGSLLGDRIRMASHFNHPDVFIRSLATRGALGGLSAKTIEMSEVLRVTFRETDVVARMGGDEFVALALNCGEVTNAVLSRLRSELAQQNARNALAGLEYQLSTGVGIARFSPDSPRSLEALLAIADRELYLDKRQETRETA